MSELSINTVENIRAWFITCPQISSILTFSADYIGQGTKECSIYSMPSTLTYTEDVVGNITYNVRQVRSFVLAVRFPYGDDTEQNLDNIKFFDDVQNWMYLQNTLKNFPLISDGTVVSIMPVKTAYVSDADANGAIYEIQFSLTYDRVG